MSRCFSEVQARLKELCPQSVYLHCNNQAFDLVLQEITCEVGLVADTSNFVLLLLLRNHHSTRFSVARMLNITSYAFA